MSAPGQDSEQGVPSRRRKSIPWRRDIVILRRLAEVEQRHLAGQPNTVIAAALGLDEGTIRNDLKRLQELWREHIGAAQEDLRAKAVRELEELKRLALEAAAWDLACERAVLYGQDQDGLAVAVTRDDKGSAQFRGQKAASLNVARQSVMDIARVLGLIVERSEHRGEILVREYVGVAVDTV